jgi:hypothetical protein
LEGLADDFLGSGITGFPTGLADAFVAGVTIVSDAFDIVDLTVAIVVFATACFGGWFDFAFALAPLAFATGLGTSFALALFACRRGTAVALSRQVFAVAVIDFPVAVVVLVVANFGSRQDLALAFSPDAAARTGLLPLAATRTRESQGAFFALVTLLCVSWAAVDLHAAFFVDLAIAVVVFFVATNFVDTGVDEAVVISAIEGRRKPILVFVFLYIDTLIAEAYLSDGTLDTQLATRTTLPVAAAKETSATIVIGFARLSFGATCHPDRCDEK